MFWRKPKAEPAPEPVTPTGKWDKTQFPLWMNPGDRWTFRERGKVVFELPFHRHVFFRDADEAEYYMRAYEKLTLLRREDV